MENPIFWPLMAFMALSVFVGTYTVRFVLGSGKRFLVCGKSMPFIVIGTALAAQGIDGNATLGNAGLTYSGGLWAGLAIPLGLAASLFVVGRFLAAPLNRMDLITLPEFFYRRYGRFTELTVSILTFVTFCILLAGNLAAVGWIISTISGWSYPASLLFGAAVVFVYTIAGGLYAAIWTDFLQLHVAILGFLLLAGWIFFTQDWQGALAVLPAHQLDFSGLFARENGALLNWASMISLALGNTMALDFMERVFAANSPSAAKRACYYAGVLCLVVGACAALAGLVAHQMAGNVDDTRMVLPALVSRVLPFGIGVLVVLGVAGASMSTGNGAILVTSAVLARNIIQRWTRQDIDDHRLLIYTRMLAVPMALGGTWFAWVRPEPGVLLVLAFDIVFAGCVVPLFAGLYWPKSNEFGALCAILGGTLTRIVCAFAVPEAWAGLDTLIPPVVSGLVFFPACLYAEGWSPNRHSVVFERGPELAESTGD